MKTYLIAVRALDAEFILGVRTRWDLLGILLAIAPVSERRFVKHIAIATSEADAMVWTCRRVIYMPRPER